MICWSNPPFIAVPGLEAALAAAAVPQVALRHLRGVDATALHTRAQRERDIYIYIYDDIYIYLNEYVI